VLLVLLALAAACASMRAPGDKCLTQDATCADSKTALACRGGKAVSFACGGPKGCQVNEARMVSCDQSEGTPAGGPCFPEYQGLAQCDAAASGYLVCVEGTWQAHACEAGSVCVESSAGVVCAAR
jgi:hypothetical protein